MSDQQLVPTLPPPLDRCEVEQGAGWVTITLTDAAITELSRTEVHALGTFFDAAWAWAQAHGYHQHLETRDHVRCVTVWTFLRRTERPF